MICKFYAHKIYAILQDLWRRDIKTIEKRKDFIGRMLKKEEANFKLIARSLV